MQFLLDGHLAAPMYWGSVTIGKGENGYWVGTGNLYLDTQIPSFMKHIVLGCI